MSDRDAKGSDQSSDQLLADLVRRVRALEQAPPVFGDYVMEQAGGNLQLRNRQSGHITVIATRT